MRALLDNLDRWVSAGEEPPESAVPRLTDGTAAPREDVLAFFRSVPGVTPLATEELPTLHRLDLGPDAEEGIADLPAEPGEPYPCYVSAVDGTGNETAGIRLPDVAVPLASHTGWNPRHPSMGGAGQNVDMLGSTLPLPRTAAVRARTGDPRPSIEELYSSREAYLSQARAAAEALVSHRHLLPEDVELVLSDAAARYDFFTRP